MPETRGPRLCATKKSGGSNHGTAASEKPGRAAYCRTGRNSVRNRRLRGRLDVRIDGDAAQQVERRGKRLVVLLLRRNIGLRSRLLGAIGREMSAHRGLALGVGTALQLVGHVL